MTAERWAQVKDVFQQALLLEPGKREACLAMHCNGDSDLLAEVRSLLESASEDAEILDTPSHLPSLGPIVHRVKEEWSKGDVLIGRVIGPYRIQSLIGEGGMGSVYLGVREDAEFRMQVAIKVLNRATSGYDIVERFRLERQILARLNHPFIARIFDGGITEDGLLYFVMEYIQGIPLDEYLRRTHPSLVERLQLFRELCSAVSFAHQNLVVHSDIKMGNILIMEDGMPKLLDFGISRVLDAEGKDRGFSDDGQVTALTPAYASPEQLRGEQLNTASDIYSLGVLLYEMVCDRRPYEPDPGNPLAILAKIAAGNPPRPSEISTLPGVHQDLDAVILKAIQPRPENRFITANHLSQDVSRYLNHQPVSACPDTALYHTRKFLRRNRVAVMVGGLAVASLVGGVVASTLLANRAEYERQRAEARFEDVRQLASSMIFELDADLAKLPGATGVRGKLVERALEYLDRLSHESGGDSGLQRELAAAYEKLGDVQGRPNVANIGNTALALECYRKALSIREALSDPKKPELSNKADIAQTYSRLSSLHKLMGDYQMGLQYDRDALRMYQEMLALDPNSLEHRRKVASSYTGLGGGLSQIGDWDGALESRRQALRMFEEIVAAGSEDPEDKRGLCLAHRRLGGILLMLKDAKQAENHYRKALSLSQEMIRENATDARNLNDVAAGAIALGGLLHENGQYLEAMERYRQAIQIHEDLAAADPLDARNRSILASTVYRLARAMIAAGDPVHALPLVRRTLDMREALASENPMNAGAQGEVGESHMLIGDCLGAMRDRAQALASYRRAMAIFRQLQIEGKENAVLEIHRRETLEKIRRLERS
ncbi:MAG: protein kinase [Bryobacterales bacterium]|nr:protein kinase [Bryobacterales bacterium]